MSHKVAEHPKMGLALAYSPIFTNFVYVNTLYSLKQIVIYLKLLLSSLLFSIFPNRHEQACLKLMGLEMLWRMHLQN